MGFATHLFNLQTHTGIWKMFPCVRQAWMRWVGWERTRPTSPRRWGRCCAVTSSPSLPRWVPRLRPPHCSTYLKREDTSSALSEVLQSAGSQPEAKTARPEAKWGWRTQVREAQISREEMGTRCHRCQHVI